MYKSLISLLYIGLKRTFDIDSPHKIGENDTQNVFPVPIKYACVLVNKGEGRKEQMVRVKGSR